LAYLNIHCKVANQFINIIEQRLPLHKNTLYNSYKTNWKLIRYAIIVTVLTFTYAAHIQVHKTVGIAKQ